MNIKDPGLNALQILLAVLVERYPDDPSRPGVSMALVQGGELYGSVCRYHEPFGQGKDVVCKARSKYIHGVVLSLCEQMVVQMQFESPLWHKLTESISQLREFMIEG